jgi:hypothetical protein
MNLPGHTFATHQHYVGQWPPDMHHSPPLSHGVTTHHYAVPQQYVAGQHQVGAVAHPHFQGAGDVHSTIEYYVQQMESILGDLNRRVTALEHRQGSHGR